MVIQISHMTSFPESPEPGPVKNPRGVKKAGPFAKLLAGLIRNLKNQVPSPANGDPPLAAEETAPKTASIPQDEKRPPHPRILFPFPFDGEMSPELIPEPLPGIAGEDGGEEEEPVLSLGRQAEKAGKTLPAESTVTPEIPSAAGDGPGEPEKTAAPEPEPRERGTGEAPRERAVDFSPLPEADYRGAVLFSLPRGESGETEKKQPGRSPEEPRPASKTRERRPGLEVRDLRSGQDIRPGGELRTAGETLPGNREAELVVELRSGANRDNPPGENPPAQGGASQAFE
ncbi:MAG: hypothetical protein LBP32_02795, partial [Spirochaetaceae bacterium]|nr:hypothetical protein [Spirochaetaceae bacterium]